MPMTSAATALNRTAPAAKSFITLIDWSYSGFMKSHRYSIAVFTISDTKTIPMAIATATHSMTVILKMNPAITTTIAAIA